MPEKTWVEKQVAEWQAIPESEFAEPVSEPGEGETESPYVLPFHFRQMYTFLYRKGDASAVKTMEEFRNDSDEFSDDCVFLRQEAETLIDMFFLSVNDQFPELKGKLLGIRKGWKVVLLPEKENRKSSLLGC